MHRSLPHGVTREGLAGTAKQGKRVVPNRELCVIDAGSNPVSPTRQARSSVVELRAVNSAAVRSNRTEGAK